MNEYIELENGTIFNRHSITKIEQKPDATFIYFFGNDAPTIVFPEEWKHVKAVLKPVKAKP